MAWYLEIHSFYAFIIYQMKMIITRLIFGSTYVEAKDLEAYADRLSARALSWERGGCDRMANEVRKILRDTEKQAEMLMSIWRTEWVWESPLMIAPIFITLIIILDVLGYL
jgi:hypothetical protein